MRAIRRCGSFSGSKQENVRRGTEWRGRVPRVGGFAFAGPHWQDLRAIFGRHLPNDELLRRLVPMLLIGFVADRLIGFTFQLIHGKQRRTRCWRRSSLR